MRIIPFATSHDAAASFGFRIDAADGDAVGYLTDSGIVTAQAHAALRDVRILALESNHDPKMLAAGPYPYIIKRRIASNSGHLSNGQAAAELGMLVTESRTAGLRLPQRWWPCTCRRTTAATAWPDARSKRRSAMRAAARGTTLAASKLPPHHRPLKRKGVAPEGRTARNRQFHDHAPRTWNGNTRRGSTDHACRFSNASTTSRRRMK